MMRQLLIVILLSALAFGHTVDYQVDSAKAVVVTVRFGDEELASYSPYEVFRPQEKTPFQAGRTDALGRVVFAPNQPGQWTVKVQAESTHGLHGVSLTVDVSADAVVVDYQRPLVSKYTRLFVGVALLLGFFGFLSLTRKRQATNP